MTQLPLTSMRESAKPGETCHHRLCKKNKRNACGTKPTTARQPDRQHDEQTQKYTIKVPCHRAETVIKRMDRQSAIACGLTHMLATSGRAHAQCTEAVTMTSEHHTRTHDTTATDINARIRQTRRDLPPPALQEEQQKCLRYRTDDSKTARPTT